MKKILGSENPPVLHMTSPINNRTALYVTIFFEPIMIQKNILPSNSITLNFEPSPSSNIILHINRESW